MYEEYTYTFVNPFHVQSLRIIATDDPEYNLTCKDMRKALQAMNKAPDSEMAYMLKSFSAESTSMACLSCDDNTFSILKT